jgi:hypothetical protein
MAEPIAVAFPDRCIRWVVGDVSIGIDDPDAPVLLDRNGDWNSAQTPPSNIARSCEPPAGWRPRAPAARPLVVVPPVANIPDVPFHFQATGWFCGPAANQMILDFAGEEIDQWDISDVQNASEQGPTRTTTAVPAISAA